MSNWRTTLFRVLGVTLILALALQVIPVQAAKYDTSRLSIATDGTQANNHSYKPSISPDGGYMAFWSSATNLVANDANAKADVFLRDIQAGTTILISVSTDGVQGDNGSINPSVSNTGRYVVFESAATNLVANDGNGVSDIFVRDTLLNTTTLVSVNRDGTGPANQSSSYPVISADGRYIAFQSNATDLVPGTDANGIKPDIYLRDLHTNTTTRLSVASDGTQGNNDSTAPSISGDGRYVAFESLATNLVSPATSNKQIFLRDTQDNITTLVSVNSSGVQGNAQSRHPAISSSGEYVAFDSIASNLVSGDSNGQYDVFLRDTVSETTVIISVAWDGTPSPILSSYPTVSGDGRYVAFMSAANLIQGDKNGAYDVFVRDIFSNTTTRVSIASDSTQGNAASTYPAFSDDGQFVVFLSDASTLVGGDTNGYQDVFLHQRGGIYITASNTNPTAAASVQFIVTFDEDVTGVEVNDFTLTTTQTLAGVSVTGVSGAGAVYVVTVNTGTGSGLLRLDIPGTATILDEFGDPVLGLPYMRGEMYVIDRIPPTVVSVTRDADNPVSAATVNFTVTFSEDVIGVDVADFSLTKTGTLSGEFVASVSGQGATRTVTVNTGTGTGTLRLDLPVTAVITDLVGNVMVDLPFTGGQAYTVRIQTFEDVPTNYWAWHWIERLYSAGITGGCSITPLLYCPENPVTRAQMAIFLERGINGPGFVPPTGSGAVFTDVLTGYWALNWIEKLYADGITGGCSINPLMYCPENPVTRAQMAIFLLRSKHGSSYNPPEATGTMFTDVPSDYWAAKWIEQLAAEAITSGCGGGNYCPENPVTRDQMAIFLVRTFSLP